MLMFAELADDHELIRRTRLNVASASSAGRVISSSTCAGSALGYGIWISSCGKLTSGRKACGRRGTEIAPSARIDTIAGVAVTRFRRLQRGRFTSDPSLWVPV